MKKLNVFVWLVPLALILGSCSRGPVLAKVGGEAITESDLQSLGEINPRLKPRLDNPAGKQKILENFVEQTLFYREATRRRLDRSDAVRKKLELYKKIIIAQAALDDELDKQVKEYYDNHKDEFERVKISHLLIRTVPAEKPQDPKKKGARIEAKLKRTDEEAQKLVQKLQERLTKGEDFGKVASEVSEDETTKKSQGDLGYVTIHDKRLERFGWLPLAEQAFGLKENEVSGVVKTKDGFHLVKVTEGKKAQAEDEADPGIRFRVQNDVRTKLLDELKQRYKVVYTQPATTPTFPSPTPAGPPPVAPTGAPVTTTPPTPSPPVAPTTPSTNP